MFTEKIEHSGAINGGGDPVNRPPSAKTYEEWIGRRNKELGFGRRGRGALEGRGGHQRVEPKLKGDEGQSTEIMVEALRERQAKHEAKKQTEQQGQTDKPRNQEPRANRASIGKPTEWIIETVSRQSDHFRMALDRGRPYSYTMESAGAVMNWTGILAAVGITTGARLAAIVLRFVGKSFFGHFLRAELEAHRANLKRENAKFRAKLGLRAPNASASKSSGGPIRSLTH
jgi:hypothetical protein